jgi:hypothetical protein
MPTIAQKHAAEQDFRCLLDDHGLPQPDSVVYDEASLRFLWHAEKLCVVVDIDENGTEWVSSVDSLTAPG